MRKSKPFIWFGLAMTVGIVWAFVRAISYEKTGTPVILSSVPTWVSWITILAAISFWIWVFFGRNRVVSSIDPGILHEKAPVKLVLLSLVVWLVSSYLFGIIIQSMTKASYPPPSRRIAPILAWVPAITFFLYFHKRKQ